MYTQHFGLSRDILSSHADDLWDDGHLATLKERFQWLLESPGIGILTGESGVGKTATIRQLTGKLNPHRIHEIRKTWNSAGQDRPSHSIQFGTSDPDLCGT